MPDNDDFMARLNSLADQVGAKLGADVLVYSGAITPANDDKVIDLCRQHNCRDNVILVLSTFGGDARAAYRIARRLQESYKRFIVFVYGFCKSAGTLLALGASELVLSDYAELGPLDVQVRKTDEAGERSSGLTPMQALDTLQERAFGLFEHQFKKLREMEMTTKLAAEIASRVSVGLLGRVYGQIDPMKLGELSREIRVAIEYGQRLIGTDTKKKAALIRLVTGYPTHGFAIDRREADSLFDGVRAPSQEEEALAQHILGAVRYPADPAIVEFVGTEKQKPAEIADVQRPAGDGGPREARGLSEDGRDHGRAEPGVAGQQGTAEPATRAERPGH